MVPWDTDAQSAPGRAAKPKSQVPVWRQGPAWSVLSVAYQRFLKVLADPARLHQSPLTKQLSPERLHERGADHRIRTAHCRDHAHAEARDGGHGAHPRVRSRGHQRGTPELLVV
ncbi:hypothetical protein [Streptomyces sp. NBC_01483]|uniref:hypothetical protein n=1 Tax=Streptomyces sp. NBC_01483 TaxID=2903883 RepID=UPI002E36565B|nr:hypothetical protein [Streptomyces sp. NBC_01483]